ncbi:hypothetical protein [Sphingomonas quercus]|uniref:Uncharacterized protein n=1 Tax=Sphingomonas quercus TaxID=2842451 RepID=A0ABS6BDR0_9SPHN|nr:hypothetical protein [Sphingomonas quercus]MBU3076455.1 hypothetical protein [Sphingomonas quercus]
MFDQIDRLYFEMRAKEEREKERRSPSASIALTHRMLAQEYERRAAGETNPFMLNPVPGAE